MIISVSGKPGSGKSTVAEKLAAALGYERIYIGEMRREIARKKGMSLAEFNAWSETHPEGDHEFDQYVKRVANGRDNVVLESRTAFHFIPQSLKIFLNVTDEEGARRIWQSLQSTEGTERNEANGLKRYEDVLASVRQRLASDMKRYKQYYGLDIFDPAQYDVYLDVSEMNAEEEFNRVLDFVKSKL